MSCPIDLALGQQPVILSTLVSTPLCTFVNTNLFLICVKIRGNLDITIYGVKPQWQTATLGRKCRLLGYFWSCAGKRQIDIST